MTQWKWLCAAFLSLSTCGGGPLGVLVDIGSWPDGAVSLQVAGQLNGVPNTEPLLFPDHTTRFVVYLPDGQSGQLHLSLAALDANNCPRATADAQLDVERSLRSIRETNVEMLPSTPPYCPRPTIEMITPDIAPTSGGIAFSLSGTHILPGATLTIAGNPVADLSMTSPTTLLGTIPPSLGSYGFVPVVLRNTDGQTASRSDVFSYHSSQLAFASMAAFATDKFPTQVTVGDWNGDQITDLAVANGQSSVSILFGDGQGRFGPATNIPLGANVTSIAAADLNGDKKPDLAVVSYGSNSAKILLNNGKGVFNPGGDILVSLGIPGRITVADTNGDQNVDLIVPCAFDRTVNVMLGTGLGSFSSSGAFAVGMGPNTAAVGDFNGDKKNDLAISNASSGNVSILLGSGQGQFVAAPIPSVSAGNTASFIVAADVNEDSKADLVLVNTGDNSMSVFLGDGNAGFSAARNFGAGNVPYMVALADVDGDRHLDAMIASGGDNSVRVLRGDGKGSFGMAASVSTGTNPRSVAVGDFNGDMKPDLVTSNYGDNTVSVILNQSQ